MRNHLFAATALVCLLALSASAQNADQTPETSAPALRPAAMHSAVAYAPPIKLPALGIVFATQSSASDAPIALHATEIKSNSHAAGNFARSMVYAGPHSTVELNGLHSTVSLPVSTVLYVRLSSEHPDLDRERVTLIRLQPKTDTRQVLEFSRNIFGGGLKRRLDDVAVEKLDVEDQPVLRITPVKPLEPGEYGVTFLPRDPALFADTVYDFTIAK